MTQLRFRIALAARTDFDSIAEYIRRGNPARAASFSEELARKIETVAERPLSFPARPDIKAGLRSANLGDYVIVFRISGEEVEILRILHRRRDIQGLFRPPA